MLAQNHGTPLHSITRLVLVEGSREGWATYAEKWAAELSIYGSPFDEMGSLVNSVTINAVADMGMQVMGWSVEQAATYLGEERLFDTNDDRREWAADIARSPINRSETFPIDALKYEAARTRAQDALGSRFDTRECHQMLLSEGALPIRLLTQRSIGGLRRIVRDALVVYLSKNDKMCVADSVANPGRTSGRRVDGLRHRIFRIIAALKA